MAGGKAMTSSRSHDAFEALYRTEYARVLRFFRKRVGADDASDLAQEVFLKLFTSDVAGQIEHPRAYCIRSARNLLADRARRKTPVHIATCPIDEGLDAPTPPEQAWRIEERDVRRVYRRTLLALPRRTRRIFLMHRLKRMTYAEISEQVGIGYKSVNYHMMRALARCRKERIFQ
ncbi:sigma-70 family RNA polymerase sigma factor [Novosphingobium sp.]|uniref:sigma-70 family RNA polymerase sigma factor n=1 Tax=Novosphingobium sp. TaxID=1874826 RepID=UPI00352BAF83